MSEADVAGVAVDTRHWIGGRRVASAGHVHRPVPHRRAGARRGRPGRRGRGRRRGAAARESVSRLGGDRASRTGPRVLHAIADGVERADRGSVAGRDPRQRIAAALPPAQRDAAGRAQLPLLRRLARRAGRRRPGDLRPPRAGVLGPGRGHRGDHAVERPAHAGDLADRARARGREHGGGQAAGVGAADRQPAGRHHPRGRAARRCLQRRPGPGRGGRRGAGGAPGRGAGRLHRLGRDRPPGRRGRGRAADPGVAGAGRQVPAAGVRGRRPGPGGRPRGRPVRQRRAGVPGGHPAAGRGAGRRGVHRPLHRARRRRCGRATRGTRPPTSARTSPASTSTGWTASSRRAIAAGARPLLGGAVSPALGGLYYQPTLLAGAEPGSEILTEEVFGPVLTLQTFGGEDEAVALANDTRYGLAATMFTGDTGARRAGVRPAAGRARSGSTASSSGTCGRRSVAPGCPGSAGRAAPGASTSTPT